VNTPNKKGSIPAHVASAKGHIETLKVLIEAGVDVNTPNKDGCTPVHMASQNDHFETLKVLIAARADVDKTDTANSYTAVHWVSSAGHAETLKVLIAAGADLMVQSKKFETALDVAKRKKHSECVTLLETLKVLSAGGGAAGETRLDVADEQEETSMGTASLKEKMPVAPTIEDEEGGKKSTVAKDAAMRKSRVSRMKETTIFKHQMELTMTAKKLKKKKLYVVAKEGGQDIGGEAAVLAF
jgi:hypothetical protein